jgi:hypothetical protein
MKSWCWSCRYNQSVWTDWLNVRAKYVHVKSRRRRMRSEARRESAHVVGRR